jgi:hypothetical protein
MQQIVRLGVVSVFAAAISACAPPIITVTPVGAERTYPPTADSVAIPIYSVAKPDCPFDEIAVVSAEGTTSDEALAALRKNVRAVGGQAILGYTQLDRGSTSVRTGTAVRFQSPGCAK